MKLTGKAFLSAIDEYFSHGDLGIETTLILLLPGLIFMLWLFLYSKPDKAGQDPFDDIPDKDMELIKQVASQKGLSSFDRDFLITQALSMYVKPISILLDKNTFERCEKILADKAVKAGNSPDSDENVKAIKQLKSKLF